MSIHTKNLGNLELLVADNIPAVHCFTTRLGGVSQGSQEGLNLAIGRGDTEENVKTNLRILSTALGFDTDKLVLTRQIHSDIVRVVTEADCRGPFHRDYPECDALVTNTPGVTLLVFTADCTPILLHDPATGAVGAIHAGWRGTVSAIAAKAGQAMADAFGSNPGDIRAAIGPNIGPCHFETDGEVPAAMIAAFGSDAVGAFIEQRGSKYHLDLKAINAMILRRQGVLQIETSSDCTYCQPDRVWSHRYTRGQRGSQGALITCQGVAK